MFEGSALRALTVVGLLVAGAVGTASAQARGGQRQVSETETRMIREASTMEARGDHAGAERVLRSLLEQVPTSTGALFAIERSLRAQGRTQDVLPMIDRTLAVDPRASNLRSMKLRILVEVDSLDTLERDAEAWIRAEPGSPDPYREIARMYERAYGSDKTVALLRSGRQRVGDPAAFAVELGDMLERAGQLDAAAQEWSLAIGNDGGQAPAVIRRVGQLPDSASRVVPVLIQTLDKDPTTPARRMAAVRIALAVSRPEDARRIAPKAVSQLDLNTRRSFLEEIGRRGEELDAHELSLWAYQTLRDLSSDPADVRTLHTRVAAAALAMADTAKALEARDLLARSLPRGSTERRRVLAETLRLQAPRSTPDALGRMLAAFRQEFPDAPELDDIASSVAYGLQAQGNAAAATAVLQDVQGPRSSLERAYLALDRGQVEEGITALEQAVESLAPSEATDVIELVSLLGKVGPGSATAIGHAVVMSHRGSGVQAVEQLAAEIPRLPDVDRASLLALAARLADDSGADARGADLRRQLISTYKDSAERAEASLALARWSARSGRQQEAIAVLEALIVDRPNSPLVPDARRELERIRGTASGGRS